MTMSTAAEEPGLVHAALFYRSEQEYLDGIVPFLIDGLEMGQPVMAAVPGDNLAVLRDGLGDAAGSVVLADMTEIGRNPGRILGTAARFVAENPGRRVRIVGEPLWPGRSEDEYPACVRMEALSNKLFEHRPVMALCPYNAGRLDEQALADTCTTHPLLNDAGSVDRNADYAPAEAVARHNKALTNSAAAAVYTVTASTDLSTARSFAARYASSHELSADGIADLQLIATELATNSLEHAGGACRLAFWVRNGNLICEASDSGQLEDPLAGYRAPTSDAPAGRGLFLVHAIADLVRVHTSANGTTIQAYLRLGSSDDA
jgi:anti-sigma regulatory factor (Ser/Thr protein kinase)